MKKFQLFLSTLFIGFTTLAFANTNTPTPTNNLVLPQEEVIQTKELQIEKPKTKTEIMIGYYGRPYTKSLGILGQSSIEDLVTKMRVLTDEYSNIDENFVIKPTFHIIYDLATLDDGRDGDHITSLRESTLIKYIEAAQKENFSVIIDLQLGTKTPLEAITPVLKYLQYDNVHFALDPEFKIPKHKRFPPGKFIGHIFGQDVNEVQEAINNYMLEHNIEGKRTLIVHMFYKRMLRKRQVIKNYDSINLVFNIDGHGSKASKVKIFNHLYNEENSKIAKSGFKIFYKNDKKPLMTPKQILGLDMVGKNRLKHMPVYINYQ